MYTSSIIGVSFNSQADAMRFAICFTSEFDGKRNKINYVEAKELYDFICDHVTFPQDNEIECFKDIIEDVKKLINPREN